MAFNQSLASKLRTYQSTLDKFRRDMQAKQLKIASELASMSVLSLQRMIRQGSPFMRSLESMKSAIIDGQRVTGKKAGQAFAHEFTKQVLETNKKTAGLRSWFDKVEHKMESLSKRRAGMFGGWGDAEEAEVYARKAREQIQTQIGLNNQAIKAVKAAKRPHGKEIRESKKEINKIDQFLTNPSADPTIAAKMAQIASNTNKINVLPMTPQQQNSLQGDNKKLQDEIDDLINAAKKEKQVLENKIDHEKAQINTLDKQIEKINEANVDLEAMDHSARALAQRMKALEIADHRQDFMDKAFLPIKKIADFGIKFFNVSSGMLKPVMLLAGAFMALTLIVKKVWGEFFDMAKVFREGGYVASQAMSMVNTSVDVRKQLTLGGTPISAEEIAQAVSAVTKNLGGGKVPTELIERNAYLKKNYNLDSEQGAQYLGTIYRLYDRNVKTVIDDTKYIQSLALANGVSAQRIFAAIAESGEQMAKAGNMSREAFDRAAIKAERIGISMSKVTGLADRLVSDFEGSLKTQAEVQTMFPGADMSEIMYSSQFGNQEQIQDSIHKMVNGLNQDWKTLPRSFKLALERTTGFSSQELGHMMGQKPEELMTDFEQKDLKASEQIQNAIMDNGNSLQGIIEAIGNVASALIPMHKFFSVFFPTSEDFKTKPSLKAKAASDVLDTSFRAASIKSGADTQKVKDSLFVPKGTAVTPVANKVTTEDTLSNAVAASRAKVSSANTKVDNDAITSLDKKYNGVNVANVGNTELLAKMTELISEVKKGQKINVTLNGKKVGEGITQSNSRGT
jgi:hypothetical protein